MVPYPHSIGRHSLSLPRPALVDLLGLVVVRLEEIRDQIYGQWEDDRRVLLRGNGVQRLQEIRVSEGEQGSSSRLSRVT